MHSLGSHVRRATSDRRRWNHGLRIAGSALVLVALLLSATSCGGSSARSSTAKKHAVQRGLYIINAKTGAIDESFPDVDFENYGLVNAAVSDGNGGWYIGGTFSRVGDVSRNGLARLRSDGSVDPGFAPRLPKRTRVIGIVRHGNTVYIDTVPSEKKHGYLDSIVAALDATSGRRLWQVPAEGASGFGNLAFANGTLFVGGYQTMRVAGIPRSGLAALDPGTGKPTSWHVHLANGRKAEGDVEAMSIENGVIYYSGFFKGTETYRENKVLGAFSIRTGKPTSWNSESTGDLYEATAILATHGQVLAGGKGFAVFDARTGRIVPWSRRVKNSANAFAVSGDTVYLSATPYDGYGILTRVGGKRVHNLAAVVLPSGEITNWRPMPSPIPYVRALAVSGQNVLVCG
jgi:outer membrane protein assembly factor BamB